MDQDQIATLHKQASDNFQKGDYDAAQAAWSELLEFNPDDERAMEGAKLCEIMSLADQPGGEGQCADGKETGSAAAIATDPIDLPLPLQDEEGDSENSESRSPHADPGEMPDAEFDKNLEVLDGLSESVDETSRAREAEIELSGTPDGEESHIEHEDSTETVQEGEPGEGELELDMNLLEALDDIKSEAADPDEVKAEEGMGEMLLDLDPAGEHDGPEPCEPNPAAQELTRRIDDLLHEAAAADDDGRSEEALEILSRLFILDEEHEGAKVLEMTIKERLESSGDDSGEEKVEEDDREELHGKVRTGVTLLEAGDFETSKQLFEEVLEISPGHEEALHLLEQAERMIAEIAEQDQVVASESEDPRTGEIGPDAFQDHGAIELEGADAEVESLQVGAIPVPEALKLDPAAGLSETEFDIPEDLPGESQAKVSGKGTGRALMIVAAVVVIAMAGAAYLYFGTDLLKGGGEQGAGGAVAVGGSPDSRAVDPLTGQEGEMSTEALLAEADRLSGVLPDAPTRDNSEEVRQALERAALAMEEQRYGEAVIAYNDALAVDPTNKAANDGLIIAGREYRARKAEYEELERAKQSFISGDFTSALKVLYRLPEGLAPESVERYKANSWYNMGIVALKAGDTVKAMEHLDDALAIRPDDQGALEAKAIAAEFEGLVKDLSYYARVERLNFRTLDDR